MDYHWHPLRKQGLLFGYRGTPPFGASGVPSPKRATLADSVGLEASDVEIRAIARRETFSPNVVRARRGASSLA